MIKLKDILQEIGDATSTFPIRNKSAAIKQAHDFVKEVQETPWQAIASDSITKAVHAEFLVDKQKYSLNYVFDASVKLNVNTAPENGSNLFIDCTIGFAAKDLNKYPELAKTLTTTLYDKKPLIRITGEGEVSKDRKKITIHESDIKYFNSTFTVEEISKTYLKNRNATNVDEISSAAGYDDVDYELNSAIQSARTLDLELVEACYKSTQYPSLIFVTRKTTPSAAISITTAYIDFAKQDAFTKKLINNIVRNTSYDYKDKVLTGGGKPLSVLSTITNFGKELFEIIPTNELRFAPAARPGEEESDPTQSGRGKLYLAFVKKQFPTANVSVGSDGYIHVEFKTVKSIK